MSKEHDFLKKAIIVFEKDLLEVEFLADIRDVDDAVAFEVLCAVADGSHIGSVVVKASI